MTLFPVNISIRRKRRGGEKIKRNGKKGRRGMGEKQKEYILGRR